MRLAVDICPRRFWRLKLVAWAALVVILSNSLPGNAQVVKPAIRVRLNRAVFEQASKIVAQLVEYEVPRVSIPATRQCFTEGCVEAHSFWMSSFRQPSSVAFEPAYPNRFRIRVNDFDFLVTGQLSGSVQVIINIPVTGNVIITGRRISVSALLDLQKTVDDQPYLRFVECRIDGGVVDARLANMGLLTDTINTKYKAAMSTQSRMQLEEAICENMNRLTQAHFSTRLARIPRSISAKQLLDVVLENGFKSTATPPKKPSLAVSGASRQAYRRVSSRRRRQRRAAAASDDYYDDIEKTDGPSSAAARKPNGLPVRRITLSREDVNNFFNLPADLAGSAGKPTGVAINFGGFSNFGVLYRSERLAHVMIDTTLMDAASTANDFSLGIAGNVYSTRSQGTPPYSVPYPFRLPQTERKRMVEVVVSQYTLNSLLFQAHRTNSLLFHVDSKTPGVGSLLKTTCTADEVCISDEVDKIGKVHPNRRLELIIRSTQAPTVTISNDVMTLTMMGRCIFFLEGTRQKIGVIPFSAVVDVNLRMTNNNTLQVGVKIRKLDFASGIDLVGLTAADLEGLRRTTKTALENMINGATASGFPLSASGIRAPLRLSAPHLSLLPGVVLLQADVDLYKTLYH